VGVPLSSSFERRAKLRRELAILHPARAASFSASLGGVAD
jgi:hypothetical protein